MLRNDNRTTITSNYVQFEHKYPNDLLNSYFNVCRYPFTLQFSILLVILVHSLQRWCIQFFLQKKPDNQNSYVGSNTADISISYFGSHSNGFREVIDNPIIKYLKYSDIKPFLNYCNNFRCKYFILCFIALFTLVNCQQTCSQTPISLSNISSSINNINSYSQQLYFNLKVGDNAGFCFNLIGQNNTVSINATISTAFGQVQLQNCYYTDDCIVTSNCYCSCSSFLSPAATCPNCQASPPFGNINYCYYSDGVKSTCPSKDCICCRLGISCMQRFKVCQLGSLTDTILDLTILDSLGNTYNPTYSVLSNYFTTNSDIYNISIINSNVNLGVANVLYVQDVASGVYNLVSTSKVNTLNEFNPAKFGYFQYVNGWKGGTAASDFFSASDTNCALDRFTVNQMLVQYDSLIPGKTRNTMNAPLLVSGIIYYDCFSKLSWIGIDYNGQPQIGPEPITTYTTVYNPSIAVAAFSIYSSCIVTSGDITSITNNGNNISECLFYLSAITDAWTPANWRLGYGICPNVTFFIEYDSIGGHTYCRSAVSWTYYGEPYPYTDSWSQYTFNLTDVLQPLPNATYSRKRVVAPTPISINLPISGSIDALMIYNGYQIQNVLTTAIPLLVSACVMQNIFSAVVSSQIGNGLCLLSSYPPIIIPMTVAIFPNQTFYSQMIYNLNYTGPVNATLSCNGLVSSYCLTVQLTDGINAPILVTSTTSQGLNPFSSYSGLSWYFILARIVFLLLLTLVVITVFLGSIKLFLYCCRKPKTNKEIVLEKTQKLLNKYIKND
jgi:hypothetical protein